MELFDDMFDEGAALSDVNTDTAKTLSGLVRNLRRIEQEIEDTEQHLKHLKQEKHKLSIENIPALMDEMGVERVDVDGVTVTRKLMVHASIPAERKEEAYDWLRDNNLDDAIGHAHGFRAMLDIALDLVLHTRVAVNDKPLG